MERVIIIGTGVFGLSTAEHIRQRWPETRLSVISQPSRLAPSDDISKIVRVDYNNSERMTEAVEAQRQWNSNKFSQLKRSIGRIVIYEEDDLVTLQKINNAREGHGLQKRQQGDSKLMRDTFGTTTTPESLTYVFAWDDSIVDWETCMLDARARAKEACTDSGGTFYESGVATLIKDEARITALILKNGEKIEAGNAQIVLAVGPWLAQVLTESGIPLPPKGRSPVATGLFSYAVQLNEEQAKEFGNRPMVSHSGKAEFLPPARGSVGKVTWIHPFTNLRGSTLSLVEDLSNSALARLHMHEAIKWARGYLPSLRGARITSVTSYWDGVTETQDPIIARHPQFENLVCAAGGSFNRAKDLPTIGDTVADVLSGEPVSDRGDFATLEGKARQYYVS
ncbi:hypothetical protein VTI28DRAFT_9496 [Corynascus sepedonium]